jgi:hypothetical protein
VVCTRIRPGPGPAQHRLGGEGPDGRGTPGGPPAEADGIEVVTLDPMACGPIE